MSAECKYRSTRYTVRVGVLTIFCLTSLLCETVYAEGLEHGPSRSKRLGLSIGTGIASYREDLLVPLGFNGPSFYLGAVYTQQSTKSLVHVRLGIGMGILENRFSHRAWSLMPDIRLSWVRKIMEDHAYGLFWGGVSLPLQMNNLFFESWDDAHLYWLTAHGIAGAFQWDKRVSSKYDATLRVEIPFFAWVSRPPSYRYTKQDPLNHLTYHLSEPNKHLHFETVDTYRNVFAQLLLKRKRGGSVLGFGIEFQYFYFSKPEKILALNTRFVFSYRWGVGH